MRAKDKSKAIQSISANLHSAGDYQIKSMLCALFGHPPVVDSFMGQLTCARCEDIVGDTLAGASNLKGKMVRGHNCEECNQVWKSLTPEQRLLTDRERKEA